MNWVLEIMMCILVPVLIMHFIIFPIMDENDIGDPNKLNCKKLYHYMTNSTVKIDPQLLEQINGNYIARCMK